MGKSGGKGDDEDHVLWKRIAETARPLSKGKHARTKPAPLMPERVRHDPKPTAAAVAGPMKPKPKPLTQHVPRHAELDRQTSRQLAKGRVEVDARLDLHGMRQREAHAVLRRFLKSAQAKGHRHVLIITGKGAAQERAKSFYDGDPRGVLRQAVPHWLGDPELAPIVISFSQAPQRLGGEGALYVRLRKAKTY
jgi:DNA-nicking Smr family endonuclease